MKSFMPHSAENLSQRKATTVSLPGGCLIEIYKVKFFNNQIIVKYAMYL